MIKRREMSYYRNKCNSLNQNASFSKYLKTKKYCKKNIRSCILIFFYFKILLDFHLVSFLSFLEKLSISISVNTLFKAHNNCFLKENLIVSILEKIRFFKKGYLFVI
jgi:hypothetical protein